MRRKKQSNTPKITETIPRTIARFLFFLFIAYFLYKESGIVTTLLLFTLMIENALHADKFDYVFQMLSTLKEKTIELIDFQNN